MAGMPYIASTGRIVCIIQRPYDVGPREVRTAFRRSRSNFGASIHYAAPLDGGDPYFVAERCHQDQSNLWKGEHTSWINVGTLATTGPIQMSRI